jgi:hypothetical protein
VSGVFSSLPLIHWGTTHGEDAVVDSFSTDMIEIEVLLRKINANF